MDITYIPMVHGFVYLAAVMDWASRRVLSRRVSITLDGASCSDAGEEAIATYGCPTIFTSDHGAQRSLVRNCKRCQPGLDLARC